MPATWQDVYKQAAQKDGIVYQGAAYEGLTCDFLELAFAAGGEVLSEDGTSRSRLAREPQGARVHGRRHQGRRRPQGRDHLHGGAVPHAFETGRATFMRNWPYAYATGQKNPKIKGNFDVARTRSSRAPARPASSAVTTVVSEYTKNPGGALAVLDYFPSEVGDRG